MAILKSYIDAYGLSDFTNTSAILGYTDEYATAAWTLPQYSGVYVTVYSSDLGTIPEGSTINSITAYIVAKCNVANSRTSYSATLRDTLSHTTSVFDSDNGGTGELLGTTDTFNSFVFSGSELTTAGFTLASIKELNTSLDLGFVALPVGNSTSTVSLKRVWLEVDFTPPAGTYVLDLGLSESTLTPNTAWTDPANGVSPNGGFASRTTSGVGALMPYNYLASFGAIPANAILLGIRLEVDCYAASTAAAPYLRFKFFNWADGVYDMAIDKTVNKRYILGSYTNTLARTTADVNNLYEPYLRFYVDTSDTTIYLDGIRCQVIYKDPPVTGNTLLLGDLF